MFTKGQRVKTSDNQLGTVLRTPDCRHDVVSVKLDHQITKEGPYSFAMYAAKHLQPVIAN